MTKHEISRRYFLLASGAGLAACTTDGGPRSPASLSKAGYKSPNEKLNIGAIGAGGKGASDIGNCASENVVALCDVDWKNAAKTFERFPQARKYKDFRQMLDKEKLDAVTISTADHTHAIAALWAMQRGIHVYVQKPLTHNLREARVLAQAARKYKVATQMGNQGHSGEGVRLLCEMMWSGMIGDVKEVHAWTNRPVWPQGVGALAAEEVPSTLDWDLFLGPAPMRPYNAGYTPFKWRGFWDWGCGALGDMACHILDGVNWAMQLTQPTSVECVQQEGRTAEAYPTKSIVKFEFPARKSMPALTLTWYEGGLMPPRPAAVAEDQRIGDGNNGSLFVGDKGLITSGTYCDRTRLLPDDRMADFAAPPQVLTRSPGHFQDWIRACKGGEAACSNFDYAGPFTEWVLLGTIAQRFSGKLLWDATKMEFTNRPEANQYVTRQYRKGWELPAV